MNHRQTRLFSSDRSFTIYTFRKCVKRYQGNYKVKSFTCLDQYLCMAFAQMTFRESLRDIEACLRAQKSKLYHMGIRSAVSRNTLANANKMRDWRIYAEFAQSLIQTARRLYIDEEFDFELENTAYALDSSTIDLCLSVFPWAHFRQNKGSNQTAYSLGSARQHSYIHSYHRRKISRRQCTGHPCTGSRQHLHYGSRLFGFRTTLCHASKYCLFRYPGQIQFKIPPNLFTPNRQKHRIKMRSDHTADRILHCQRLSRKTSANKILRSRKRQNLCIFNQQFSFTRQQR